MGASWNSGTYVVGHYKLHSLRWSRSRAGFLRKKEKLKALGASPEKKLSIRLGLKLEKRGRKREIRNGHCRQNGLEKNFNSPDCSLFSRFLCYCPIKKVEESKWKCWSGTQLSAVHQNTAPSDGQDAVCYQGWLCIFFLSSFLFPPGNCYSQNHP